MIQTILEQLTFDHLFALYLGICIGIALITIGRFAYEDITCRYDRKFGPNYKSGFSWTILICFSLPALNIITAIMFTYIAIRNKIDNMGKKNAKPV